jgi:Rrf2 family protein
MFSKACQYGIRAAIYIANESLGKRRTSLKQIAEEIGSPEAFTAKILQQLVRSNIIDSVKGAAGGFEISPAKAETVKLMDIVLAIDKLDAHNTCVLGLSECSEKHPCPVHHKYKIIKKEMQYMLSHSTLLEMTGGLKKELTYLKY